VKTKPFPWKCAGCREKTVYPAIVDYATTIEQDGRSYEVRIPNLEVPRCQNCGKLVMVESANREVTEAFRRAACLLTPSEIRQGREALRLTQNELANHLRVAEATVCRWESGGQIQQRSMDMLLRMFFDVPQARQYLGMTPATPAITITSQ